MWPAGVSVLPPLPVTVVLFPGDSVLLCHLPISTCLNVITRTQQAFPLVLAKQHGNPPLKYVYLLDILQQSAKKRNHQIELQNRKFRHY